MMCGSAVNKPWICWCSRAYREISTGLPRTGARLLCVAGLKLLLTRELGTSLGTVALNTAQLTLALVPFCQTRIMERYCVLARFVEAGATSEIPDMWSSLASLFSSFSCASVMVGGMSRPSS